MVVWYNCAKCTQVELLHNDVGNKKNEDDAFLVPFKLIHRSIKKRFHCQLVFRNTAELPVQVNKSVKSTSWHNGTVIKSEKKKFICMYNCVYCILGNEFLWMKHKIIINKNQDHGGCVVIIYIVVIAKYVQREYRQTVVNGFCMLVLRVFLFLANKHFLLDQINVQKIITQRIKSIRGKKLTLVKLMYGFVCSVLQYCTHNAQQVDQLLCW